MPLVLIWIIKYFFTLDVFSTGVDKNPPNILSKISCYKKNLKKKMDNPFEPKQTARWIFWFLAETNNFISLMLLFSGSLKKLKLFPVIQNCIPCNIHFKNFNSLFRKNVKKLLLSICNISVNLCAFEEIFVFFPVFYD
jgi:hypothetical protein